MSEINTNTNSGLATFALIIAIIALIFSWVAFNRSGADLGEVVEREVEQATMEIRAEYQELEANVRTETSESLENAAEDVSVDGDVNNAGE